MNKTQKALKLALEAIEHLSHNARKAGVEMGLAFVVAEEATDAIREALADQPAQQQEPDYWLWADGPYINVSIEKPDFPDAEALYTSPPANKPWVGLTEEEIQPLLSQNRFAVFALARAIEAKLREKNA